MEIKQSQNSDKHTEIFFLLDRSGSMHSIADDAVGGLNAFIEEQSDTTLGTAYLTLAQFDDEYEEIMVGRNLEDVEPLKQSQFIPRGRTALLDSISKLHNTAMNRIKSMDKKPDHVFFVVLTDGKENASQEMNKSAVKSLVSKREEEGWEFSFMTSSLEAFNEARNDIFTERTFTASVSRDQYLSGTKSISSRLRSRRNS